MIKIVTSFGTLMKLAKAKGIAEKGFKENPTEENEIKLFNASRELEDYQSLCLSSDEMTINSSLNIKNS